MPGSRAGTTTILVTHDQEEALSLSNCMAVLHAGWLEQFAPPTEAHDRPAGLFVNGFVGQANRTTGTTNAGGRHAGACGCAAARQPRGGCLRPEHLRFVSDGTPAILELTLPLGPAVVHEVGFHDGSIAEITKPRGGRGHPSPARRRACLPRTARTLPTSWADLQDPICRDRVGIANPAGTLGTGLLVGATRTRGGSEGNVEPGFAALEELRPNLSTVAANSGALAALAQAQMPLTDGLAGLSGRIT